jgi:hypothetical protein
MESQTSTEFQQHQSIIVPYGTVERWRKQSDWGYKHVSPMELLRLMWSTKFEHSQLALAERGILSVLLNHVNRSKVEREGLYEAYPSIETITANTDRCDRAVGKYIKSLKQSDWVRVVSGRGKGQNNHYFINAPRIVSCYGLSNPEDQKNYRTGIGYEAVESVPFPFKRNTTGLKRGRSSPLRAHGTIQ